MEGVFYDPQLLTNEIDSLQEIYSIIHSTPVVLNPWPAGQKWHVAPWKMARETSEPRAKSGPPSTLKKFVFFPHVKLSSVVKEMKEIVRYL